MSGETQAAYNVLRAYRPSPLMLYQPEALALLVYLTEADEEWNVPEQPWPDDLPPIAELVARYAWYGNAFHDTAYLTIRDEMVPAIYETFDRRTEGHVFVDGDRRYYMVMRPLLPDEVDQGEPLHVSWASLDATPQPLPFACD